MPSHALPLARGVFARPRLAQALRDRRSPDLGNDGVQLVEALDRDPQAARGYAPSGGEELVE